MSESGPGFRVPGYPGSYPAGTRVVKIPEFESTSGDMTAGAVGQLMQSYMHGQYTVSTIY
jgi:hypothetical protein